MADIEKVIKESEEAIEILGKVDEPTFWLDFVRVAFENALSLLKAQGPRVMTAYEMIEAVKTNEAVYVEEIPEGRSQHCFLGLVVEGCDPPQDGGYNYPGGVLFNVINAYEDMWDGNFYGLNSPLGWRCWTSRPMDEQREATQWAK